MDILTTIAMLGAVATLLTSIAELIKAIANLIDSIKRPTYIIRQEENTMKPITIIAILLGLSAVLRLIAWLTKRKAVKIAKRNQKTQRLRNASPTA